MRGPSKFALALVLALAIAFGLTACGGGGDSATSTAEHASPADEEPHSPPAPGFHQSGKLDIPAFGIEAKDGEREQAEATLEGYLQAREAGDWAKACTFILASARTQLLQLAAQLDPTSAKSCAAAFATVSRAYPKSRKNYANTGVSSLRVKPGAGAGFALFHGSDGADYWMPMKVEGGKWKVLSTAPTDLSASR